MKKKTLFGDILETVTKYFLILVGVVLLLILLSSIRTVKSGNVALVLRFGRLVGDNYEEQVHEPGLLFALPYIIDEVITVPSGNVFEQNVDTYYTEGNLLGAEEGGYLITGDSNIAVVSASVKYTISDPVAYALGVSDPAGIINGVVSNAMLSIAASTDVDLLLTSGKEEFSSAVLARSQERLDAIGVGVTLGALELTQVAMPREVRQVYDQVTAASVRAATIETEAKQYYNSRITTAEAEKESTISQAKAAQLRATSSANLELAEFWGLQKEYAANPEAGLDTIKARLYADKMTKAIQKIGTVRAVENGETKIFLNP